MRVSRLQIASVKGSQEGRLLVVDAQNTFMDQKGPFGSSGLAVIQRAWDRGIVPLLERCRDAGICVGWTQAIYEYAQFGLEYALLGVRGPEVVDPYTGREDPDWQIRIWNQVNNPGESIFPKNTNEPFTWYGTSNGLEYWLGSAEYVVVVGFTTTSCVKAAVIEIQKTRRKPIIPEDCVGVRETRLVDQTALLGEWSGSEGIIVVASQQDIELVNATRMK
jgi:nicotinamidase-related amidase